LPCHYGGLSDYVVICWKCWWQHKTYFFFF